MNTFSKRVLLTMMAETALAGGVQAQTSTNAAGAGQSEALETIVVTAERRSEDVQKTPVSVNVQSGEDLLREGRYSLRAILEDVPGVSGGNFVGLNNGGTDTIAQGVTIRGVQSNTSVSTVSNVPATAIYVDGVYEGVGGGYDIDRVEVLRGPQGTLYGRSATAGVISYHTRNPQLDAFGAQGVAEIGNYALQHYTGVLNVPLLDDVLALRVAANKYDRDGFDSERGGRLNSADAKAKLLYRPSDALSMLFGFAYQKNKTSSGGGEYVQSAPDAFVFVPSSNFRSGANLYRQYWAEVNWNLGAATLTYLPAYRSWYQNASSILGTISAVNPQVSNAYTPLDNFSTQELRLSSNPDSKLIWQTGVYYYYNSVHFSDQTRYLNSGALSIGNDTRRKTLDNGIFAEVTYPFTDTWRVTAGARYDHTRVQTVQTLAVNSTGGVSGSTTYGLPEVLVSRTITGDEGTRNWDTTTYKLRFEHDLAPQNLLYAMVSTGFLPGDVRVVTGPNFQPQPSVLDKEILKAYEIGSKNRFLNNSLQINGSIFYYDYGAYQNNSINVNAGTSLPPSIITVASPVKMKGGEVEFLYQITEKDRAGLSAGYTDAKYSNKPAQFAQFIAQERVPGSPPLTANASYSHLFMLAGGSKLSLRGEALYRSSFSSTLASQAEVAAGALNWLQVESSVTGNIDATWTSSGGKWSFTGYVRNVADDRSQASGSVTVTNGVVTAASGTLADPRTIGAIVSFTL